MKRIDLHKFVDFMNTIEKIDFYKSCLKDEHQILMTKLSPIILPDNAKESFNRYVFFTGKISNYKIGMEVVDGKIDNLFLIDKKIHLGGFTYSHSVHDSESMINIRKIFKDRKYSFHIKRFEKFMDHIILMLYMESE